MANRTWAGWLSRTGRYLDRDLWDRETAELPWLQRALLESSRALVIVGRGFVEDQLLLRASALTYSTLLALVPFFALAFAALKGLGVQNQVEPWLLSQVAAGARETVTQIVEYINKTDVRALGALGLVLLVLTVVSVIGNVEKSLNTIWGAKTQRTWLRRFSDYLSLVVMAPIVLFATLTVTTTLENRTSEWMEKAADWPVLGWIVQTFARELPSLGTLLPYLLVWAFFTFLYLFLPNTKVRLASALLAGLVAGILWQLMQWGYVKFQVGVAKYNMIYGTLAQLPILLVWLYLSWVVFLLGAELAFAHQHLRTYAREREAGSYSELDREALGLRAMIEIARRFQEGGEPWTAAGLCGKLNAPLRLANETLFQLQSGGLLAAASEGAEPGYLLARDPERILLTDILGVLRTFPGQANLKAKDPYVLAVLEKLEKSEREALKDLTLKKAVSESARKES